MKIDFFSDTYLGDNSLKAAAESINTRLSAKLILEMGALLCECADSNDIAGFKVITAQYPELINFKNADGDTPLICAVYNGHQEIVELALQQPGVDVNACGENSTTAFMWACEQKRTSIGKLLLGNNDLSVTAKDDDGDTALILAVENEETELVKLILERDGVNVEETDAEGGSAHSIAEKLKDLPAVQEIRDLIKAHATYVAAAPKPERPPASPQKGGRRRRSLTPKS